MTVECLLAMILQIFKEPVAGKRVLEVGSQDVNGSIRPFVEALSPSEYIGVDMVEGKGVDMVVDSGSLIEKFGPESFDYVISSAVLEHVYDWKAAIHNMKRVCRPGGTILVITCSQGFQYHGYPYDYWRFEPDDLRQIFSDCQILALLPVFKNLVLVKAIKPVDFVQRELEDYELYSIVTNNKVKSLQDNDFRSLRFRKLIMRTRIMAALTRAVGFIGSRVI